ncbi:MAG: hypothetical protein HYX90_05745, partial [Chloroflexi bacterium]|nr:hypothetical protein [Chloroflexota bacterium]
FAGKTITAIVPYAAGGGTDILARIIVRIMPEFIPGKPTIIVRNMPGGGGIIGADFAYNAKPDGLTFLFSSGGIHLYDLMGAAAVKYDLKRMLAVMGVASGEVFYVPSGVIEKPEDIVQAKGLIFGGTAGGAPGYFFVCAEQLLKIPTTKVILAYTGTGDVRRAFLSGEVNITADTNTAYYQVVADWVAKGQVKLLWQTGLLDEKGELVRASGLPTEIPTVKEVYERVYGKSPSGMPWEAYKGIVAATRNYDKVIFLPPGTPDGIVRAYWSASQAMLKSPKLHEVSESLVGKDARWMAGESFKKEFELNYRMDPPVVEWLRNIMTKYGVVL